MPSFPQQVLEQAQIDAEVGRKNMPGRNPFQKAQDFLRDQLTKISGGKTAGTRTPQQQADFDAEVSRRVLAEQNKQKVPQGKKALNILTGGPVGAIMTGAAVGDAYTKVDRVPAGSGRGAGRQTFVDTNDGTENVTTLNPVSSEPLQGTNTTTGDRDAPLYPKTYTVSGVTYDTASGRAINPDTGETSDNGYSIDPSSGARSDGPPSIPRDRMADASEYDRMAAWAKANPTLAAKVKPGQAGYESIQKYLNPVTDSTIQDFADDSGYDKPEAEAILKGGSVESVIDSSGISTTITTPQTTSNPASPQDGANPFADISDQYRVLDIPNSDPQEFKSSYMSEKLGEILKGKGSKIPSTYFPK